MQMPVRHRLASMHFLAASCIRSVRVHCIMSNCQAGHTNNACHTSNHHSQAQLTSWELGGSQGFVSLCKCCTEDAAAYRQRVGGHVFQRMQLSLYSLSGDVDPCKLSHKAVAGTSASGTGQLGHYWQYQFTPIRQQ